MKIQLNTLRKHINKTYLKETTDRTAFDSYKRELSSFLTKVEAAEAAGKREEHVKNYIPPFLNKVGFGDYFINTDGDIDLAINTDSDLGGSIGVIFETKRPLNRAGMIQRDDINRKAMHEAVLYYLDQRIEQENNDIRHVIITNALDWFVFDAQEFERVFYNASTLRKEYESWAANRKVSSNKDYMYEAIARYIQKQDITLWGTCFDLRKVRPLLDEAEGSEAEKKLIPFYKFFTPVTLLKEPFANDSNRLNKEFYRELLYILGLEEHEKGSTKLIDRLEEDRRILGSLIENTISTLRYEKRLSTIKEPTVAYGEDKEDQLFGVAMELCILWTNRVLFLKLLEAQLYRYHYEDPHYRFLNYKMIDEFDELNKLFFWVLAVREEEREANVTHKFGHIPYLNSSLFDPARLEDKTTRISGLDDKATMPVYQRSVLTDKRGQSIPTLQYLFEFLDAFDFTAEGKEDIKEDSKALINASVLGLIFEKINGYKDGSFYTPGFITEYMCRETLHKAVVEKFREELSLDPSDGGNTPSSSFPLPQGRGMSAGQGGDNRGRRKPSGSETG